jgi:hypothetical protein
MTPEAFAALGARLVLIRRFYFPLQAVAVMSDHDVVTLAKALVDGDAR